MPLTALALVLVAALLHALWNIVAKKAEGGAPLVLLSALGVAVLWAPLGLWAAWGTLPHWGPREWGLVLASGLTHLAYFHVLLRGYAASDLTVVYPVARGTGPLISACGALLLLDERLSLAGALGIAGVTAGVFLVAGGPGLWAQAHDPARRRRVLAGVGWGAATGVLIAGYTLIDGYAVKVALLSPILVDYFGNLLRLPFMLPAALRARADFLASFRRQWRHALLIAVCSPLGYVLVLYAATMAPLSHVAPAREVSMLFAALLGGRLLGEGDRGWRLAGAACIGLGVAGLALG
ncbi:EamA family transporter [Piscinibacter sakaiensis]|uniref:Integral membrane protein n=1 Tax=Piscinibacter sakaiensis TaxID=1547922 RepID=A0A0K8P4B2_PISS1|nr:EamA family transporter [Piscinibacter sakaiensis]GAP37488.1 integral membrane protein [Piscinibacter sakaiensis]